MQGERTWGPGYELVHEGAMHQDTLNAVSRPLIPQAALRQLYNEWG